MPCWKELNDFTYINIERAHKITVSTEGQVCIDGNWSKHPIEYFLSDVLKFSDWESTQRNKQASVEQGIKQLEERKRQDKILRQHFDSPYPPESW